MTVQGLDHADMYAALATFQEFLGRYTLQLQDFTEEERDCLSREIPKISKEPDVKSRDQAFAIAVSKCAPSKARQFQLLLQHNPTPQLPGGKYTSRQNEDGSWDILNVPMFVEHDVIVGEGKDRRIVHIGQEWMEAAKETQQARKLQDNYLPPLHVHHHNLGKDTIRAGFWEIRQVRQGKYQGRDLWVTFGNYLSVPNDMYQEFIRTGQLPYRSVEIKNVMKQEIDSLALLDTEVPFFRLPMLTIGKEIPHGGKVGPVEQAQDKFGITRAYRSVGAGAAVLMYMDQSMQAEMMHYGAFGDRIRSLREEKEMTLEDLAKRLSVVLKGSQSETGGEAIDSSTVGDIETGEIETPSSPVIGALARVLDVSKDSLESLLKSGADPADKGKFESERSKLMDHPATPQHPAPVRKQDEPEEKKPDEKMADHPEDHKPEEKTQANTPEERMKAAADIMAQCGNMLMQGAAILQGEEPSGEPPVEGAPEPVDMQDKDKNKDAKPIEPKPATKYADPALAARVDILENDRTKEKLLANVGARMVSYGLDGATVEKRLDQLWKEGQASAVNAYAAAIEEHFQVDPPPTLAGAVSGADVPAEVLKYQDLGQPGMEKALMYSTEYDDMKGRGMNFSYNKDHYVAECLKADGFKVETPKPKPEPETADKK